MKLKRMKTTRSWISLGVAAATTVAAVAATGSCFLFPQEPTLTVEASGADSSWVTWPLGQDTARVLVINGLDDPKGLAGLEIEIGGAVFPERLFTATAGLGTQFVVPDGGRAMVTVRLMQDGRAVAEGTVEWDLESEIQWTLVVERAPYHSYNGNASGVEPGEDPRCGWFWCHGVWRLPIAEDAANYEDEALWLYLERVHPGECQDVC